MRILYFKLDEHLLKENQASLSDTIRLAMYQANKGLFERLNYEDDYAFLEPSLFCIFLSDVQINDRISLGQSLFGYADVNAWSEKVVVKSDQFGLVNLPNLGYLRTQPNINLKIKFNEAINKLTPNEFVPNTKIRLCLHPTDLLAYENGIIFDESPEQSLINNKANLLEACYFFRTYLSDFWQVIASVTREFVVFNSPSYNSFAGIMQHGTAYFNIENKIKSPIFFLDDIAHQCGHIIFNALTLQTDHYLTVPKDHSMKGYSERLGETRGAYGAFHGMFTYTTILNSLDRVLDLGAVFDEESRHEALGRIGFYIDKFGYDLKLIYKSSILTSEGINYWKQFEQGFQFIKDKYGASLSKLDFSNQPYVFQYDFYKKIN